MDDEKRELITKIRACYRTMTNGRISCITSSMDDIMNNFNELYIENAVAKEDLIRDIIKPDMTYEEIINAVKDYFG